MKGIFSPVDNVRIPPVPAISDDVREPPLPGTVEDVHEPPLPSNNGSKDELPGEGERIDPEDGGGRAPQRLSSHEPRS